MRDVDDKPQYVLGNSDQVLNKLATRTLQNEAGFISAIITGNQTVLDAGCGVGSITRDLAQYSPDSAVYGIDIDEMQIAKAQNAAEVSGIKNVHFSSQTISTLDFPDSFFDVVFAHTVFMHLPDPQLAMDELYRVCKTGGVIALREGVGSLEHFPSITIGEQKRSLNELLSDVLRCCNGTPDIGLRLKHLVHTSGFKQIQFAAQAVSYQTSEELQQLKDWYASMIQGRTGELALQHNLISSSDLAELIGSIHNLPCDPAAISIAVWGELIARKES